MKGREAQTPIYEEIAGIYFVSCEIEITVFDINWYTGKRKFHMKDEICEPLLAILMPSLLQNGTTPSAFSENHLLNGWKTPPYIDILDQLFNQVNYSHFCRYENTLFWIRCSHLQPSSLYLEVGSLSA